MLSLFNSLLICQLWLCFLKYFLLNGLCFVLLLLLFSVYNHFFIAFYIINLLFDYFVVFL